jgi:UDP-N-acetylmuramoyl-tripeptide--D-alanyl-D-alanine ligase
MKQLIKKFIIAIITVEARLILWRHKPKIVAVVGSVGKTSTKEAIASVLKDKFSIRKSVKSYNSEIGVPLVVLGGKSGWNSPFLWLINIVKGIKTIFFEKNYPEWLVLELGVERPKDMKRLSSWLKPNIVVITTLPEIPPHVEFFSGIRELVKEKIEILKKVGPQNFVILNADDETVCGLSDKTKARIVTYGFSSHAELRASNYLIIYREKNYSGTGTETSIPEGISFKVDYKGSTVPVRLFGVFGRHHVYSALAALSVSVCLNLNFIEASQALAAYQSPPGRLKLIEGMKGAFILDDSYNSSPTALRAALDALNDIPAKRKIVVVGDMLELGKYTIEAHKSVAPLIGSMADIVFTVGPRARFIAEALKEKGFNERRIFEFSTSEEAKEEIKKLIESGDLILVKGSQAVRMEKIVKEIMAHPEEAKKLLVRQEDAWQKK